jgi:hypothetical protein
VINLVTEAIALQSNAWSPLRLQILDGVMIRKLKSGKYRLYSRKKNPKTGKRRNLGTFNTKAAAKKHERAVQYFKRGLEPSENGVASGLWPVSHR